MGFEPDVAVSDGAIAGDVEHLTGENRCASTAARELVVSGADDVVEPGVGEVPHVGDDDGAGRQRREERTRMHRLALTGVGEVVDMGELLGAHVEGAGEIPGRRHLLAVAGREVA
jgi:hypothetical protein